MPTLADITIRLGVDARDLARGMQQAQSIVSAGMGRITAIATSGPVIGGMAAVGAGIAGVSVHAVKLAADLERAKVAFGTLLGSATRADTFLRELAEFAARTPFSFDDVRMAAQRFLAFGFAAEKVVPILTSVGSAAAALGGSSDLINRIVYALGQMRSLGRVTAGDMKQLAEAGIPAWEMLAAAIGVTIPEAMERAQAGTIDAATAIEALITQMGARFPGMMAKQAATMHGMWSTIKDEAALTLTALGEKIATAFDLRSVMARIQKWMGEFRATLESQGVEAALSRALGADAARELMGLFQTLKNETLPMLASIGKKLIEVGTAAAPYLLSALNHLLAAIPQIAQFLALLPAYAKVAVTGIAATFNDFATGVKSMVRELVAGLDALPFVDLEANIARLDDELAALAGRGAKAWQAHEGALAELTAQIEAQRRQTAAVVGELPAVAETATETVTASIIRITAATGDAITGALKGGFGRGGEEGASEVRRHIDSLQAYAATHPITVRVRYVAEDVPPGLPVAMPAG